VASFLAANRLNQKKGVMTILSIQECRYLQSFGGQMKDPAATLGMRGREFLLIVDIFKCI